MSSLTLKNIGKSFGNVIALSNVDIHIQNGEFCVLLGPSGCGKSTLLQIVAGLLQQDEGSVLMDGQAIDRLSPRERDVAMVFQSYALYPHMTVLQNLGFGLRVRGIPRSTVQRRILETSRLLGIEHLLDRKPRQLSGGQRQRVAMGRALARRPKLFLFDEPLSNLDARLRANVRLELKRLHRQIQGTILYVTHDQVEAMTLGDMVIVMQDGRIRQVDTPQNIYTRPADTFVATFVGSPQMNLFSGEIVSRSGRPYFRGKGFFIYLGQLQKDRFKGELDVGIRPEDIGIGKGKQGPLLAKVVMITDVGSERYIHAQLGEESITIRATKKTNVKQDEVITLIINPDRLHIFYSGHRI